MGLHIQKTQKWWALKVAIGCFLLKHGFEAGLDAGNVSLRKTIKRNIRHRKNMDDIFGESGPFNPILELFLEI